MVTRVLPAEWHLQHAVILVWPGQSKIWADQWPHLLSLYQQLAKEIAARQNLIICYGFESQLNDLIKLFESHLASIRFWQVANDDLWIRDFGPLTLLVNGQPLMIDYQFNGWGNKYPSLHDNNLNQQLAEANLLPGYRLEKDPMVWEGGNLESNGKGTALTGLHSALTRLRPFGLLKEQISLNLKNRLGLEQLIWIENGQLAGDDTDGHLDNLVRFGGENRLLYSNCAKTDTQQYPLLQPLEQELKNLRLGKEQAPELVPLPLPKPIYNRQGNRLPASYANFLIINGAVLLPAFDDPADEDALQALSYCFPDRDIISLPGRPLIEQFGGIHCASMQIPAIT